MGILIFAVLSFNLCFGFSANVNLPKDSRLVLASKQDGAIKVIENKKGKIKTTFEATASYGMVNGTKLKEGDSKTPNGVYFGVKLLANDDIPEDIYGPMAIALNYPNPIDSIKKRAGSGIWIHGTSELTRLGSKGATNGCLILDNASLLKLVGLMRLNQVPIIISDDFDKITINAVDSKKVEIRAQDGATEYLVSTGLEKSKDIVYEVIK